MYCGHYGRYSPHRQAASARPTRSTKSGHSQAIRITPVRFAPDTVIISLTLALAAEGAISEYVFAAVLLFVLTGLFVNVSDIGRDGFRSAQRIR